MATEFDSRIVSLAKARAEKQNQSSSEKPRFFNNGQEKSRRDNPGTPAEKRRDLHLVQNQNNDGQNYESVEIDGNQPKLNSENPKDNKARLLQARNKDKKEKNGSQDANKPKGAGKVKQGVKDAYNVTKAVSDPFILRFLRPGDWPYFLAWILAAIKDLVDFIGLGSLPAIGTVVTIGVSIAVYLLSKLVDTERAKYMTKGFTRAIILISGTTVELLFGLNFIPWETVAVSMMYLLTLQERKDEKKNKKKNPESDEKQEEDEEYEKAA